MGFDLSMEELIRHAGITRLAGFHIAGLMLKKGFVQSIDRAFDKYIRTGKSRYVDKYRINSTEGHHHDQERWNCGTGTSGAAETAHRYPLRK
ncbi:MAG: hypothetical protein R2941_03035 [Desulfobacterales bacterium]